MRESDDLVLIQVMRESLHDFFSIINNAQTTGLRALSMEAVIRVD